MQETKDAMSIDAMQKTKTTMNDASECVPPTPCGSHTLSRMRTHAAKRAASITAKQNSNAAGSSDRHRASQRPFGLPYAPTHHRWQQMMLARLGIDKTESWADQVEEAEESAQLTKTLEDIESELGSGEESGEESDFRKAMSSPPPSSTPAVAETTTITAPEVTPHGTPPSRPTGPHPHAPRDPTLTPHGDPPSLMKPHPHAPRQPVLTRWGPAPRPCQEQVATLPIATETTAKSVESAAAKPAALSMSMRLRGGRPGRDADASEGESDASGDGSGAESADEDASDVDSSGNVDGLIDDAEEEEAEEEEEEEDDDDEEEAMKEELDSSGILPTGTARIGRKPDWYWDENHAELVLKDVPAHEREAALNGDDVEEGEGEEDADEDASQSGDEDASESCESDDDEARSEASTRDEAAEAPPKGAKDAEAAAEALLGRPLSGLKYADPPLLHLRLTFSHDPSPHGCCMQHGN